MTLLLANALHHALGTLSVKLSDDDEPGLTPPLHTVGFPCHATSCHSGRMEVHPRLSGCRVWACLQSARTHIPSNPLFHEPESFKYKLGTQLNALKTYKLLVPNINHL